MAFDPDQYIAQKQGSSFDPDAYLAQRETAQAPPGLIEQGLGFAEVLGAVGSGVIAEPVAGLAGAAEQLGAFAAGAEGRGAEAVEATRKALTFEPRTRSGQQDLEAIGKVFSPAVELLERAAQVSGDVGFDIAGPLGGAIASAIPTAIAEILPATKAPKIAARATRRQAERLEGEAETLAGQAEEVVQPPSLEEAATIVSRGADEDIVELVDPDPNFVNALDELDIDAEPLASFASQNPQFRDIEQGLAAIPGSQLNAQSVNFISELSQKADNIIEEYGGTLDKAELSERFRSESLTLVDDLAQQADDLYDSLNAAIPATTKVDAPNTQAFLEAEIAKLGGDAPQMLKRILGQISTKTTKGKPKGVSVVTGAKIPGEDVVKQPTYSRLDLTRREVGQALNKKSGPFKNAEEGLLKQIYARLRQDQDAVAQSMGAADVSDAANGLIRQRKHIEDNLKKVLGRDLQDSLVPRVGAAIKGLEKGQIDKFDSVINAIPEKFRGEVILSSMNDIFRGRGAGKQALDVTQFSKFMDELNRQPKLKARLFKHLPAESRKAINSLATVSKGVSNALGQKIPTGRVAALFDENNGFLRRMMGRGAEFGIAKAVGGGPQGVAAGAVVREFLNGSTGRAKAASEMLASPQFQALVKQAVKEGVTEGATASRRLKAMEQALVKSKRYQRWADALESDKATLASVGLVSYLFSEEEE